MSDSDDVFVAEYLKRKLPDLAVHMGAPPEPDPDRRLVQVGSIPVGIVTARETLLDGTIVYEVDPFPMWRMAPHPREEITS